MNLKHSDWAFREITPEELLNEAKKACGSAYAPYSGFPVGAAILADDGRVFRGSNVENGSFGLTVCAERSAVSVMLAAGTRNPEAIAIASSSGEPCPPCGACRQVLAEFNPGMIVVLEDGKGSFSIISLKDLFPMPFGLRKGDR
ncbi:MAG: cytidine deaminase [Thermovirga sp.]